MAAALKALPRGVRVGVGVGVAWGATGGATGWSGSAHSNLGARTRAAGPVAAAVSRAVASSASSSSLMGLLTLPRAPPAGSWDGPGAASECVVVRGRFGCACLGLGTSCLACDALRYAHGMPLVASPRRTTARCEAEGCSAMKSRSATSDTISASAKVIEQIGQRYWPSPARIAGSADMQKAAAWRQAEPRPGRCILA